MNTPKRRPRRPRRLARPLAATLALLALATAAPLAAADSANIDPNIQRHIQRAALGSAKVSVVVMDPDTRVLLAEHNPDQTLIPASNMKLFTSGVALAILGDRFEFRTTLSVVPDPAGGDPSLLITGSGDPGFADPALLEQMGLAADELVDIWADAAADAAQRLAVDTFHEVIIDDRVFDRDRVHPTWPRDALNRWYCAEVSGLNFHANLVEVHTIHQPGNSPPRVKVIPDLPGVEIRNRARSVDKGRQTAWTARELGTNRLTLFGDVRRSGIPIEVAITDTTTLFGRYLAEKINRRGVSTGPVRLADNAETFPNAEPIHIVKTPIRTALKRCNADSYNLYAEALLKRAANHVTGAPGSWARGSAVAEMLIQRHLDRAGVSSVRVADGSGMSRDNRATTLAIAEWLTAIEEEPALAEPFIESLATTEQGTRGVRRLASANLKNEVAAKSGFLTATYALSGYLIDPDTNDSVVFAMIVNDKPNSIPAKRVHDLFIKVVQEADAWLEDNEQPDRAPALGG